jgi:hypothetical protein
MIVFSHRHATRLERELGNQPLPTGTARTPPGGPNLKTHRRTVS